MKNVAFDQTRKDEFLGNSIHWILN